MEDHPLARLLWPFLAAIAGAITALSFRPFRNMTKGEISLALFVGFSFALFVAPLTAKLMFGDGPIDIRIMGGLFYLMASGSNILIPLAVRKLSAFFGASAQTAEEKP